LYITRSLGITGCCGATDQVHSASTSWIPRCGY